MLPKKLHKKLEDRKANNAYRQLSSANFPVDFSSNDYLGFSKSDKIFKTAHQHLIDNGILQNGASGSRLLSGNHELYREIEAQISEFHNCEAALIFNSGYNANIGILTCIAQRGDIILYDELAHASIRDGITMSNAKSYKFKHNDLQDLENILKRRSLSGAEVSRNPIETEIYIVTESVFSMDGDSPDISALIQLCKTYDAHLIIDEAHAIGVFNQGLVDEPVFAKIVTYGKALGCHGAAILGSKALKEYLINFSRPFIYTTALTPHTLASIKCAYTELYETSEIEKLEDNIRFFNSEIKRLNFQNTFIESESAIHCCIISGNDTVKHISKQLQNNGFDVKPILSPTVPKGSERLRFCLHSYNSKEDMTKVLELLATFVL
ncbi:MAG: pyridoxal phosphate-dependent aminotransferase family protein [Winogradskyella sp.]|uniref:aminotransferase class I/II-fold pyridoxal phosphate-dependent enzyme n=1 Tax=Winogradskyella sp. TaxID=1883156 RepID=UPI000F3BCB6A|nr:pyridoxal phosphate-dependent aminotransferase family protein [Winogradskyella sp.]RNC88376.1 MAG: pyridoxal phosphate-dependent aminotransferase family protein [Winogradskyella sp.]